MWLELLLSSLLLIFALALTLQEPQQANPLLDFYEYQSLEDGLLAASSLNADDSNCSQYFQGSQYSDICCFLSTLPADENKTRASCAAPNASQSMRVLSMGLWKGGTLQFLNAVQIQQSS